MRFSDGYRLVILLVTFVASGGCTATSEHLALLEARFDSSRDQYVKLYKCFTEDDLDIFAVAAYASPMVNDYYMVTDLDTNDRQWFSHDNRPVSFSEVLQSTGISEGRFRFYSDVMERLGIKCIRRLSGDVEFLLESFGHLDDGYSVDIVNTSDKPEWEVVESVYEIPLKKNGAWCIHLDDAWYLVYEYHM